MTHQTQARHIIELLGGPRKSAEITGESYERIRSYMRTGKIPYDEQPRWLSAGLAAGVRMNALDFVPHLIGVVPSALGATPHPQR